MSLHSSLKIDKAGAAARTVMTRIERIKDLMKKGQWAEDRTVTNLPRPRSSASRRTRRKRKRQLRCCCRSRRSCRCSAAGAKPVAAAAKPAAKK